MEAPQRLDRAPPIGGLLPNLRQQIREQLLGKLTTKLGGQVGPRRDVVAQLVEDVARDLVGAELGQAQCLDGRGTPSVVEIKPMLGGAPALRYVEHERQNSGHLIPQGSGAG